MINKTGLQQTITKFWHSPQREDRLDSTWGSLMLKEVLIPGWTNANLRFALKADSGYAPPTVTSVQTIKRGTQEIDYVHLTQQIDKRLVTYRATVTMAGWTGNTSRLKIEVCVWPIGARSPFYLREGILTRTSNKDGYDLRTLPGGSIYGQRGGIDPLTIGHKYPH